MTTEAELLKAVHEFNERALTEVYDLYSPGIYRYALRLLGDADQAEDCVAETFSRFLNALHQGRGPRQYIQAYLYRVAHNWITDSYRRVGPVLVELQASQHADSGPDPDSSLAATDEREAVRAALIQLTPDQRQVIVLKYLEEWSNQEVAEALGKHVGAIKALQHRAINTLRRFLVEPKEVIK